MCTDAVIGWVLTIAHQLRLSQAKTLADLVEAACHVGRATLSAIGRSLAGDATAKSRIQRTWRFCDNDRVCVADDEGRVVGYVYVALEPLSWKELRGSAGYIHDVAVEEGARHAGTATKLMEAAIAWLRERGAPRVILGTAALNATAQSLFHHIGFRDTMIEMTMEL